MPPPQTSNASESHISIRTRPVPLDQPIPDVHVDDNVTARLDLVIGADGRVKEVNVRNAIPGQTAKLIAAVQSWRFRPATENGVPVAAPFSVDISFRGNE
jgi:TonB family protein